MSDGDRCLCGVPIRMGTLVVIAAASLFTLAVAVLSVGIHYSIPQSLAANEDLTEWMESRVGRSRGERAVTWIMWIGEWVAAASVIAAFRLRDSRYIWPFLILSTAAIVAEIRIQLAALLESRAVGPVVAVGASLITVAVYAISIVYRAKVELEREIVAEQRSRRRRSPTAESVSLRRDDAAATATGSTTPSAKRPPTAPPDSEFYVDVR